MADSWRVELLADHHARGEFSCGQGALDTFLHTLAGQYSRKGVGRTYVAVRPDDPRVVGYYTLAASALEVAEIPPGLAKKLPKHPVPTILLGRLAVDVSAQKQGLGKYLVANALERVIAIADQLGVFAVHVHAIDDRARDWYTRLGFRPLADQDRHLL